MRLHGYTPVAAAGIYVIGTPEEVAAASARATMTLQSPEHVAPVAAQYRKLIEREGQRIAEQLVAKSTTLTADAEQQFLPPDEDELVDGEHLIEEAIEVVASARGGVGRVLLAEFAADGITFDIDTVLDPELIGAVARVGAFGLEDVMREIIRDVLLDAATGGWSVGDAADEVVYKTERLAPHTANAIARTDLNGLSNGGSLKAAQQALAKHPEPVYKTWLATPDERTRESHIEADGQTVALNENFQVGGFPMPYPGYPLAPAEEVINCRCTITYTSDPTGQAKVVTDPRQPPQPLPEPPADPLANVMASDEQVDAVHNSWYQDISGRVYGRDARAVRRRARGEDDARAERRRGRRGDPRAGRRGRGRRQRRPLQVAVRVEGQHGHVRPRDPCDG